KRLFQRTPNGGGDLTAAVFLAYLLRTQNPAEAWVVQVEARLFRKHDADADGAGCLIPVCDCLGYRRIIGIHWLDNAEPARMLALHLQRVARVVA
ncbi:MAG: hypothetical protein ABL878_16575, partial [Burkholderiales bacterium]